MHPCYRKKLSPFLTSFQCKGTPAGAQWLSTQTETARLFVCLTENGTILEARHDGASGEAEALLEAFCRLIPGMPLSEAREHGPLRLEYALRDPALPPPVPGLVTPENADPAFQELIRLARALPRPEAARPWSPAVPQSWKAMPVAERRTLLLNGLRQHLRQMNYQGPEIELEPASGLDRWLIGFGDRPCPPDFFLLLLSLEKRVRETTGTQVELFLEGKEDRNQRSTREIRSHDLHPGA
jgi:hypothetical protein